jgi:Enoyl-(Acyl carrier protein) reductase
MSPPARSDRVGGTEYEDYRQYWRDEVPMTRYGRPDEIAPIALLLASEASAFVTGAVHTIDGGYTPWSDKTAPTPMGAGAACPQRRAARAAATMFSIAGFTSGHLRVFSPQSGFTHNWSSASRVAAADRRAVISSTPGTRGEWMS